MASLLTHSVFKCARNRASLQRTINHRKHLTTGGKQQRKKNKGVVRWLSFSCLYLRSAVIWLLTEPSQPTLTHYITYRATAGKEADRCLAEERRRALPGSSKVTLVWMEQHKGPAAPAAPALGRINLCWSEALLQSL